MHSILGNKICVRLLECVYYGQNRNQTSYAYRKMRFCSNHNVLATTAIQGDCREVPEQSPWQASGSGTAHTRKLLVGQRRPAGTLRTRN